MMLHRKVKLLATTTLFSLTMMAAQAHAAPFTLTGNATWGENGDVATVASSGDTIDINGFDLTFTNNGAAGYDDGGGLTPTDEFRLNAVTDTAGTGSIFITGDSGYGNGLNVKFDSTLDIGGNMIIDTNTDDAAIVVDFFDDATIGGNLDLITSVGFGTNVNIRDNVKFVVEGETTLTGTTLFFPASITATINILQGAQVDFQGGLTMGEGSTIFAYGEGITIDGDISSTSIQSALIFGSAIKTDVLVTGKIGTNLDRAGSIVFYDLGGTDTSVTIQKDAYLTSTILAFTAVVGAADSANNLTIDASGGDIAFTGDVWLLDFGDTANIVIDGGAGGNKVTATDGNWGDTENVDIVPGVLVQPATTLTSVKLQGTGGGELDIEGDLSSTSIYIGGDTTLTARADVNGDIISTDGGVVGAGEGSVVFAPTAASADFVGNFATNTERLKSFILYGTGKTVNMTGNFFAADTTSIRANTLAIDGDLDVGTDQTLVFDITGSGTNGAITVTGTATIAADTHIIIRYNANNTAIASGTKFTLVTGGNNSIGEAADISIINFDDAISFTQDADDDSLIITLVGNITGGETLDDAADDSGAGGGGGGGGGGGPAPTAPNSVAANTALQAAGANTELDDIKDALDNAADAAEANEILASTTPTTSNVAQTLITANAQIRALEDARIQGLRTEDLTTGASSGFNMNGVGLWMQGFGSGIKQDTRGTDASFKADTFGMAGGVDTVNLLKNAVVGIAASFGRTNVNTTNANTTGTDVDSYGLSLYGSYDLPQKSFVKAFVNYAYNDVENARHDVGGLGITARADYASSQYGVKLSTGRDFAIKGAGPGLTLTPQISAAYTLLDTDGYTETGAGGANLTVESDTTSLLDMGFGVNAVWRMKDKVTGALVKPALHAGYTYDAIGDAVVTTATYTGGGGSFKTTGAKPERHTFNLGGGISYLTTTNIDLSASYDYAFKQGYDAHEGVLRATVKF